MHMLRKALRYMVFTAIYSLVVFCIYIMLPYNIDSQRMQQTSRTNVGGLRVLTFITSHFSPDHIRCLQNRWPNVIAHSRLLQNSDFLVFATGPTNQTLLKQIFGNSTNLHIHEEPNPGYQEGAILALKIAAERRWFAPYDWVIRLNPDVLILNDTDILSNIMNPNVDGIFIDCYNNSPGILLHTDWFAFRPSALPNSTFLESNFSTNAETQFTYDMKPILDSKQFIWLPGARPFIHQNCHVFGDAVVHVFGQTEIQC